MKIIRLLSRTYRTFFPGRNAPQLALRLALRLALLTGTCMLLASSTPLYAQDRKLAEVVRIQPFRLEKSYKFDWRKERPDVRTGLLVVIKTDTSLLQPTNGLEPVLYAGNQTVQRINQGDRSGFVIGIIPAEIDLSKEPVWFGSRDLPERVDAKKIREERAKAISSGIRPIKEDLVKNITKDMATVPDLTTLLRKYAADLILEFSPQEKHIVDAWRLPETRQ